MKTRQARLEAIDRALPPALPPGAPDPLPDDSLVQIRTLWQAGETMRIAGDDCPPETVLRYVLTVEFGDYSPFSIEGTGAAVWPVLTSPRATDDLLIDLFKQGRAICAQELARGETGWLSAMRFRWIGLFRAALERLEREEINGKP